MPYNYLVPVFVVFVQGVCAYYYFKAYRDDRSKKNLLASLIATLLTIFLTALAPYVDSIKAQAALDKQAKVMQKVIADGTKDLNSTNRKMLVAQVETRKALEELRLSRQEVTVLRGVISNVIDNHSVVATNSATSASHGISVTGPVRGSTINTGRISTGRGSIVGGTGNRVTNVGEQPPVESFLEDISGLTTSKAYVRQGQRVRIIAAGSIKVGSFVGSSTPEGRSSGVFGLDISSYNLVKTCNHAALLYRIEGEGDESWKPSGLTRTFTAHKSGHIEFQVNDNTQGDNVGSYQVTTQLLADAD